MFAIANKYKEVGIDNLTELRCAKVQLGLFFLWIHVNDVRIDIFLMDTRK